MTLRRELMACASRGTIFIAAFTHPLRLVYCCIITALECADRGAWASVNKGDICTLLRPLLLAKGIPASRIDRGDDAFRSYASPTGDAMLLEFA